MDATDLLALLPLLIVATTAVVLMLGIAIRRSERATFVLTLVGLALALLSLPFLLSLTPREVTGLLVVDGFALFFTGLILAATLVVALLSHRYWQGCDCEREEFYVLLVLAALGGVVLVGSSHFASFFLGLEILSISLYALIAYTYNERHRVEAGLKYLILAAASAAILLFGMAMLYAALGTLSFEEMASHATGAAPELLLVGAGLVMGGAGFKLALVPFHLWTPDVYQGAPLPVTAFIATVSKGAMFALILRFFTQFGLGQYAAVVNGFALLAILSMLLGNLLALLQDNLKRVLAFSSIAHMGYLLVPFVAGGAAGQQAIAFYLVAYVVASLLAFGVMTVLSGWDDEAEAIEEYRGLFWRHPWLAVGLVAALFSLAGLPPSVGLVGKFILAATGVEATLWLLLVVLVVGSVIGVFYYARVAILLFFDREKEGAEAVFAQGWGSAVALATLAALVLWLGVYPRPLLRLIAAVVQQLG
jgi:NADH-quinone oxidoreductase subunit N